MALKPSALHLQAGRTVNEIPDSPKRLMLIYEGVGFGVNLLLMVLNYVIDGQVANMGGLSAMGQQAVWSTVQAVLELVVLIFLPLWQIGLVFVAMKWSRGENATANDLCAGLHRVGVVIRLRLLESLLIVVLALAVCYAASLVFVLTPFSDGMIEAMKPVFEQMENPMQSEVALSAEQMAELLEKSLPFMIFSGVLCGVVFVLVFYRIRFADYGVMSGKGAIRSLVDSVRYTKKCALQVAKLDLHFWWYYLLLILCAVLSSGDVLLASLGVELPISADGACFLFYIAGGLAQMALLWQYGAQVATTYASAYGILEEKTETFG